MSRPYILSTDILTNQETILISLLTFATSSELLPNTTSPFAETSINCQFSMKMVIVLMIILVATVPGETYECGPDEPCAYRGLASSCTCAETLSCVYLPEYDTGNGEYFCFGNSKKNAKLDAARRTLAVLIPDVDFSEDSTVKLPNQDDVLELFDLFEISGDRSHT